MDKKQIISKSLQANKDLVDSLTKEQLEEKMKPFDNYEIEQCAIHVVMCSSCKNEIKQEDEKHAFWDEDVNDGIPLKCLDCHLETESICRDFGF